MVPLTEQGTVPQMVQGTAPPTGQWTGRPTEQGTVPPTEQVMVLPKVLLMAGLMAVPMVRLKQNCPRHPSQIFSNTPHLLLAPC
jgi:hypothetical protein